MNIFGVLDRRSPLFYKTYCVFLLLFVFILDYLTGYEINLSVLYLAPIAVAAWYLGRRWGFGTSLAASLLWLLADYRDLHPYSHVTIPYWNALVRFAFFSIVAGLMSRLHQALVYERAAARTDGLTDLLNRRGFLMEAPLAMMAAADSRSPFTMAYIDVDDFKTVNDTQGHEAGDEVLRGVAASLRRNAREDDLIARLGGDEFVLFLKGADAAEAHRLLGRLHANLQAEAREKQWPIGFSLGSLTFEVPVSSILYAINLVDQVMYQVKKSGKNAAQFFRYRPTVVSDANSVRSPDERRDASPIVPVSV